MKVPHSSKKYFMLKSVLTAIVALATLAPAFSQSGSSPKDGLNLYRVEASAGIYTSKDVYSSFQFNNDVVWGSNSNPTFFISANFFKSKRIELGVGFGYQHAYLENDILFNDFGFGPGPIEPVRMAVDYYTLLPQIRLNWFQSADGMYELYSGAGFALTLVSEQYSNNEGETFYPIPGIHVTGMGVRFGKKVGGFMEIGAGSKGFMSGGISYRL